MAGHSTGNKKGFKAFGGDKAGDKPQKPMITEMPKTKRKWGISWTALAVAVLTPFLFHQCSENPAPKKKWLGNDDTAPRMVQKDRHSERSAGLPVSNAGGGASYQAYERDYAPSRAAERARREQTRLQERALRPTEESEARRAGFGAIFQSLYRLPVSVTREIDRVMAHRPGDKALYDSIQVDRTRKFHIAAAAVGADKVVNSFVCVQDGLKVADFFHAQATPDARGGYEVKISDSIPHPGNYMTGRNLLQTFGQRTCDDGLRRLDSAMNGTGETAGVKVAKSQRASDHLYNDKGLQAP